MNGIQFTRNMQNTCSFGGKTNTAARTGNLDSGLEDIVVLKSPLPRIFRFQNE